MLELYRDCGGEVEVLGCWFDIDLKMMLFLGFWSVVVRSRVPTMKPGSGWERLKFKLDLTFDRYGLDCNSLAF